MLVRLRPTLASSFVAVTLVVVAAISFSNYRQGVATAEQSAAALIARTEQLTIENINKLLTTSKLLVVTVSEFPTDLVSEDDPKKLPALLRAYADKIPLMYSLYVGFGDGGFIQAINLKRPDGTLRQVADFPPLSVSAIRSLKPNAGAGGNNQDWTFFDMQGATLDAGGSGKSTSYDPRTRPWYKRAVSNGKIGSSEVYVYASLKEPGVTISAPMHNVPGAVVGLDIPLSSFAKFLKTQQPGEHGIIAVTSSNGLMVAHPDASKTVRQNPQTKALETVNITDVDDPLLRAAYARLSKTNKNNATFRFKGERFFASLDTITELPGSRWHVVSVASIDEYAKAAKDALVHSLIIAAGILVVALVMITILANRIASPIDEASRFAGALSQLQLDAPPPSSSHLAEIQRLSDAMAVMHSALATFLKYTPKDLVHELIQSGQPAEIGGTRQEVTLMFTDIADFTTMSENRTPEEVMNFMSIYFEVLSDVISDHNGTIDKFIGDAIMAMWNAPLANPDHVENACDAALLACKASNDLNIELAANNFPELRTRFGLHCCEALVGNVGAPDRMQFTSLGAGVNLASRIEGLNKFYKTQILVSDTVRKKAGAGFLFRRIDLVTAKGTTRPVTVFELLGKRDQQSDFHVDDDKVRRAVKYEQAFDFYLHRDFDDAVRVLRDLHDEAPDDYVVRVLLERCQGYADAPPDNDWNASRALDKK